MLQPIARQPLGRGSITFILGPDSPSNSQGGGAILHRTHRRRHTNAQIMGRIVRFQQAPTPNGPRGCKVEGPGGGGT